MDKLLVPIVALMAACQSVPLLAQMPRLIVFITVDELRTDLLDEIESQLPDGGLKRLLSEGTVYKHVQNPLLVSDPVASTAIIHTGTTAIGNGVPERKPTIRQSDGRRVLSNSVFEDLNYKGLSTSERFSPLAMSALTIGDKLKETTAGLGKVYSVAPRAEEAIIGGGQQANSVLWIDSYTGKWVGSSYYSEGLPWYVERLNTQFESVGNKLSSGYRWRLLYDDVKGKYDVYLPYSEEKSFVGETFTKSTASIDRYKSSGLVNEDVLQVAKALLRNGALGTDAATDFLSLHFTVGTASGSDADRSYESLDGYYRLDKVIRELMECLSQSLSSREVAIILSGTGVAQETKRESATRHLFRPDQCKALLNMFLAAELELKGLIDEVTPDGQVFLRRNVVPQSGPLTLRKIQDTVADFLLEFSGIQYAIADHVLRERSLAESGNRVWQTSLNRSLHRNRGDVVFGVLPSWQVADSNGNPIRTQQVPAVPTVLIMYRSGIQREVYQQVLDLRNVSTEVCHTLHIRPPTP